MAEPPGPAAAGAAPIFFGGEDVLIPGNGLYSYAPSTDQWTILTTELRYVDGTAVVWTGRSILFFGAALPTSVSAGAAEPWAFNYDLSTRELTTMSAAGQPSARDYATAIWTGARLIVWGGRGTAVDSSDPSTLDVVYDEDGASYDPLSDTWSAIRPSPAVRWNHTAVWTGSEMLVWGGTVSPVMAGQSGAYADASGQLGTQVATEGWIYDPAADTWTVMPTDGQPSNRGAHVALWTGTEMIVWGGAPFQPDPVNGTPDTDPSAPYADGAAYNPATQTWRPIRTAPNTGLKNATAVWTGTEMIVWGGFDDSGYSNHGYRYNPASDTWAYVTTARAPSPRSAPGLVWTGQSLIVWAGHSDPIPPTDGAQWFPDADGGWIESEQADAAQTSDAAASVDEGASEGGAPDVGSESTGPVLDATTEDAPATDAAR